ncbi:MAG: OmpA family protein [Verrucomicrobia bacterium]|nr:OmpA family protein [Verrucomicrobiota bacterium]
MILLLVTLLSVGCNRSSDDVWNDTRSAGRHVARGVKTLCGIHGESRQINSADEFDDLSEAGGYEEDFDFIGFEASPNPRINEGELLAQPKETPGEQGSSIPGINAFKNPANHPELASVFTNVHFEYNSSLVKGDENLAIISRIGNWMKSHPNAYIFVEGHCDSRGPAAYNFALGANRSNAVRNMLINDGVVYDRIFTISYGKEQPLVDGEGEEIWKINRRAQFKVYEKN